MIELIQGNTYTVQLTIKNTSKQGGSPVGATLGVGIFAQALVMLIDRQVTEAAFAPGQSLTFSYPIVVPPGASGPGAITAWIEDPNGAEIARAVADILVSGYQVSFAGTVVDAETILALPGVTVEMWEEMALVDSTTTDIGGGYFFDNIVVPVTMVFKYKKSGYRDTVSIPIPLTPSGGGLDVELMPLVLTRLALYYSNPNDAGATHWDAYDLDRGEWIATGLQLITEGISFVPEKDRLFLVFREARNAFFDIVEYGPFVINLTGLGEFTWDASQKRLNGVSAISLMNTVNSIRGTVISQKSTNSPDFQLLEIQVASAGGAPGSYFVGKTIKAESPTSGWNITGSEITGNLAVQSSSPGNYPVYPGFVLTINGIGFPQGLPDYLYAIDGNLAKSYNDNGSFSILSIGYYSKYSISGIPIKFEAWAGGVQRSISTSSSSTYSRTVGIIGNPGTQIIQKTLPADETSNVYWLTISNPLEIAGMTVKVFLKAGSSWKLVKTI